jgi:hypothetical protein
MAPAEPARGTRSSVRVVAAPRRARLTTRKTRTETSRRGDSCCERAENSLPSLAHTPSLLFVPGLACTDEIKDVEVFLQTGRGPLAERHVKSSRPSSVRTWP